jgi:hypothetical protein
MSMGYAAVQKTAQTGAKTAGGLAGLSSFLSPVGAGLGIAGGLSDMLGGGSGGSSDLSSAGGTLYGGSFTPVVLGGGKNSVVWIILILIGIFLLARK